MDWGKELQAQISVWEQENQSFAIATPAKRMASGNMDMPGRGIKRARTVDLDNAASDEAVKEAFDNNEVGKVSISLQSMRY